MFYAEFGFRTYVPRISNYILTFARHFDQYVNSQLVRTIDYSEITWC